MGQKAIVAQFTRKDSLMGFKTGELYQITTCIKPVAPLDNTVSTSKSCTLIPCLCVVDTNSRNWCPYENLESMLDDWAIIS